MDIDKKHINVLETAINLFKVKGLRFTLQDICTEMHIAKKTIYTMYATKEDLLIEMMNYVFTNIQLDKQQIIQSDLPYYEKVKKVMIALPEQYQMIEFKDIDLLKCKYPRAYDNLTYQLDSNWDPIFDLLNKGKEEGLVNDIDLDILRHMVTGTIENLMIDNNLKDSYMESLEKMINIIMNGLMKGV